MKKSEYLDLIKCRFLSEGGSIKHYYGNEEREVYHNYKKINDKLLLELEGELDVNNLIILFPASIPYNGNNCLIWKNDRENIVLDYCSNIVDVRNFLDKKGIKYKNNISMTDVKYSQFSVSMLIIQDGIAYVNTNHANPFGDIRDYRTDFRPEIKINDEDVKHLNVNNKQIVFAGLFRERFKYLKNI